MDRYQFGKVLNDIDANTQQHAGGEFLRFKPWQNIFGIYVDDIGGHVGGMVPNNRLKVSVDLWVDKDVDGDGLIW